MTSKDFKDLTGENPEDVFGGDWKNEVAQLELTTEDIKQNGII